VISRRVFIGTASAMLLPTLPRAQAQQPRRVPRIGVLSPGNPPPRDPFHQRESFEEGLREVGWMPGTTVLIEYRYAEGDRDRLLEQARELTQLAVDVIVARSAMAIRAARDATRTIPIVMSAGLDPVRVGLVASLAHPGGSITGLTLLAENLDGKQLELLKQVVPKLSHVAFLHNRANSQSQELARAAQALRLKVTGFPVTDVADIAPAFADMKHNHVGAVLVSADALILDAHRDEIIALAARHHLPAMYSFRDFVQAGGLMSYSADLQAIYRRSASFVDKILKGTKPADLPVEQPTKFELVINLKTAKALGLTIPPSLLARADEVIQ
jgi:putative ABC transport system substrate-binding protein